MDILKNKQIAIVGGGPGGLTLARLLQLNGANVKVYERDLHKDVRVQGATLDLHEESGLQALCEAGLLEAFKENYRPGADKMRIMDKHGAILVDQYENESVDTFGDTTFRPEIDRGPLRKILLDSLLPETVVWNSYIVSLKQIKGSWKLEFENGSSADADLVIAADGANSKIRPFITSIKPFYSGVTMIEGNIYNTELAAPKIHKLLNGGKIFAMGDEKTLIVSSKGDGSLVFYTGSKTQEHWVRTSGIDFNDRTQVVSWLKEEFSGWNTIWMELFENANAKFLPRPQYCMPLDQQWESLSNITMLGDAAHLMPPFAGEGVNMAMQDALELNNCLTSNKYSTIHNAIKAYEKQMLTRASGVAKMTLEQTDSMHSPNGLNHLLDMFQE